MTAINPWKLLWGAPAVLLGASLLWLPTDRSQPFPDDLAYAYEEIYRPFFVRKTILPDASARYANARPRSRSAEFLMPKPAGIFRIFIVGGSVAVAYAGPAGRELREMLARLFPGRSFQVVGCGMGGYDSTREALVVREILDYAPDLVILMSGNNESLPPIPAHPRLGRWRRLLLGESPSPMDTARILERFARNLRSMARLAQARGIPMLWCALPSNLRDCAPNQAYSPMDDEGFFQAWMAWEDGDWLRAAKGFSALLDRSPGGAMAHFYLAQCWDRLGRPDLARPHYEQAEELDPNQNRSPRSRTATLRQVAAEESVPVAALDEFFARAAGDGIPGWDQFRDPCHWHARLYPLASLAMLDAIRRAEAGRPQPIVARAADWAPRRWEKLERWVRERRLSRDPEEYRTAINLALRHQADCIDERSVYTLQHRLAVDHAHVLHRHFVMSPQAGSHLICASGWLGPACSPARLARHWDRVLPQAAEALRRNGDYGQALAAAERALEINPRSRAARLCRAVTLAQNGRKDDARGEFRVLLEESPGPWAASYWARHFGLQ